MMVQGIGVDLVENRRIERLIRLYGTRFLNRIYTDRELSYCLPKANKVQCLAARFAAKEAVMKAFGRGLGSFRFKDIEVINMKNGQPAIVLHGQATSMSGSRKFFLSISHTECCSIAIVLTF